MQRGMPMFQRLICLVFLISFPLFLSAQSSNFNMTIGNEPVTLNPITASDMASRYVHRWVLDRLLVRDIDDYSWRQGLAESYEISKDNKVFTFKIRKNAFFHDGKPVTSEDVKFSLEILKNPEIEASNSATLYEGISEAIAVDPHTIVFKAKEALFQNFDALAGLEIIPKHIYGDIQKAKKLNKEVIGSGPYMLARYEKGRRIVLKKFPQWYGDQVADLKDQNNFATITMRFAKEENVVFEMLKKGELDFGQLTPDQFEAKTKGDPWGKSVLAYEVENLFPKPYHFIAFNFKNEFFQSKKTREGLTLLFNRDEMIQKLQFGKVAAAVGPIYYNSDFASAKVKPTSFDPKKARSILIQDGWKDEDKNGILEKEFQGQKKEFRFSLLYSNRDFEKYYTIFQEELRKAGIIMDLKSIEWGAFSRSLDDGKFEAMAMSWRPSNDWDPKPVWHSSSAVRGGSNFIGYSNPRVDQLIDKSRSELDRKKRIAILQQIHELIADDMPYIFFFNRKFDYYAVSSKIQRPRDTFRYELGVSYWK